MGASCSQVVPGVPLFLQNKKTLQNKCFCKYAARTISKKKNLDRIWTEQHFKPQDVVEFLDAKPSQNKGLLHSEPKKPFQIKWLFEYLDMKPFQNHSHLLSGGGAFAPRTSFVCCFSPLLFLRGGAVFFPWVLELCRVLLLELFCGSSRVLAVLGPVADYFWSFWSVSRAWAVFWAVPLIMVALWKLSSFCFFSFWMALIFLRPHFVCGDACRPSFPMKKTFILRMRSALTFQQCQRQVRAPRNVGTSQ